MMCLDWILASTEYQEFVYLMLEFKGAQDWDGEAGLDYSRVNDQEGHDEL